MSQTVPDFSELIAACQHSAVHLETRDVYSVADEIEGFAAWKAGKSYNLADRGSWWNEFHQQITDAVARGVVVRRARVISEPVSEYIAFEHSCTAQNIAAGESVRWLPRRQAYDLLIPTLDYWIFDDRLIRFGAFTGEGEFVENFMEDSPEIAATCVKAFEAVWDRAIPHEEYEINR